eukprot:gnl/MRDRNA2_/MRDRNA2_243298_c0_seq1.p2 gnl/MRDRNA2_/MRDRNA2_243298_c0~~gnl/MRDRNA2_/MRDRNA2_243298_c0_seq1.p2  ORF type:complete len:108 (-),score=18.48 gnl/MRDRNA2_/MRDRNA2_243298_c0_seq1:129-452(-)
MMAVNRKSFRLLALLPLPPRVCVNLLCKFWPRRRQQSTGEEDELGNFLGVYFGESGRSSREGVHFKSRRLELDGDEHGDELLDSNNIFSKCLGPLEDSSLLESARAT